VRCPRIAAPRFEQNAFSKSTDRECGALAALRCSTRTIGPSFASTWLRDGRRTVQLRSVRPHPVCGAQGGRRWVTFPAQVADPVAAVAVIHFAHSTSDTWLAP